MPPAFVGLVEAAAATGDPVYSQAADRVAEFLIRVQVRSEDHPTLDGGWFRAFDYEKWDDWGGNGESGWAAWSSETGWAQSHIVAAMVMRERKTSLWGFTSGSSIGEHFEKYRKSMKIDRAVSIMRQAVPKEINHLARGTSVQANVKPHPRHPGAGVAGLTDGLLGEEKDLRLEWMGFRGSDREATIDLGRKMPLKSVSVPFCAIRRGRHGATTASRMSSLQRRQSISLAGSKCHRRTDRARCQRPVGQTLHPQT